MLPVVIECISDTNSQPEEEVKLPLSAAVAESKSKMIKELNATQIITLDLDGSCV